MAYFDCRVLTKWTQQNGANTPVMPPLPAGCGWSDATGQQTMIPSPNAVVLDVLADDALLAALQADSAYAVLEVDDAPASA